MLQTQTIKQKLSLGYGAMAALALIGAICAYLSLQSVAAMTVKLTQVDAVKMYNAGKIATAASNMVGIENEILLHAQVNDDRGVRTLEEEFQGNADKVHKSAEVITPLLTTPEGKASVGELVAASKSVDISYRNFHQAIQGHDLRLASTLIASSAPELAKLSASGEGLLERQRKRMAGFAEEVNSLVSRARLLQLGTTLLLVLCTVAIWFVVQGLDRSLRANIASLAQGANEVESAATQISSASQVLAQETSLQAAQIEETSASSAQVSAMALRNTEHSGLAADLTAKLQGDLNTTNVALAEAVAAIDQITQQSDKISKIIGVIDKIAFQTNILALNAAVEAARAGEAGMGFSVVAEEVRNLAQRSAEAARDTANLIEQSIHASGTGKVKVHLVADIGARVVQQFAQVKTLVDQISTGNSEQGKGASHISKAISQMEGGTQTNAANAEQSAAAAEQLTAQSSNLRQIATELGSMVGLSAEGGGGRAGRTSAQARHSQQPASRARSASAAVDLGDSSFQSF